MPKENIEEMKEPLIDSTQVNNVFIDCLYEENEDKSNAIVCEGIIMTVGFNPLKLEKRKEEIIFMLDSLPEKFKKEVGGGWSFLMACNDKNDIQWTGLHRTMEELFMLGIAIGKVEFLLPREAWGVLPGGMPYLVII